MSDIFILADLNDLIVIYDLLIKCNFDVAKWEELGFFLRISHVDLSNVRGKHQYQASRCLIECLFLWLQRQPSPRTWDTLLDAINDYEKIQYVHLLMDKESEL